MTLPHAGRREDAPLEDHQGSPIRAAVRASGNLGAKLWRMKLDDQAQRLRVATDAVQENNMAHRTFKTTSGIQIDELEDGSINLYNIHGELLLGSCVEANELTAIAEYLEQR